MNAVRVVKAAFSDDWQDVYDGRVSFSSSCTFRTEEFHAFRFHKLRFRYYYLQERKKEKAAEGTTVYTVYSCSNVSDGRNVL